jgi:hypothetical protein
LGSLGKVILGGIVGGPAGAIAVFTLQHGDEVIEGTINVADQVVQIGKDVYRAIPAAAFLAAGMPLHGLLKHEFEDELILIGEVAGEIAIIGGLTWPVLGPIGASLAIAEGAIPLYVAAGSVVGKLHLRQLNDQELEMARYVFRGSLGDLDEVILTNLGGSGGRAFVYPSTFGSILVNLGNRYVHDARIRDGPALLHELTHVWHARRRMFREVFLYDLIPDALRKVYEFDPPTATADRQWSDYGTEQQASIVEAWTLGATRKRSGFDAGARGQLALGSPLFRYINGNVRRSSDATVTGSGRSVRQLLADGGHRTVRAMHPPAPPAWWP